MAQSTTLNGVTYSIPDPGDTGWGAGLTAFSVAISPGVLQKTGGTFTLTSDVDFGSAFGLKSKYFTSRTSGAASTGVVRLANTESLSFRNFLNNGDLALTTNASNLLTFNGSAVAVDSTVVHLAGTETITGQKSFSLATLFADGTAGSPSISFINDSDTGFYSLGGNRIAVSIGGTQQWAFTAAGDFGTNTGKILAGDGLISSPSYQFTNDPNTGMYSSSNDILGFATAGTTAFLLDENQHGRFTDGSAALPSISFINDADTGIYRIGANSIGVSTNTDLVATFTSTGVAIRGTTTNDSASAGNVGEYVESVITTNTNFPTSGTFGDLTSISLTAGDWDVTANLYKTNNGATVTEAIIGISQTAGDSTTGLVIGSNQVYFFAGTTQDTGACVPSYRISLASTTTIYFKYRASFTVATPQARGRLSARRVR